MNQQILTPRNLETNARRSTLRILLLVLFTTILAVPGLAQVTNQEQPKNLFTRPESSGGSTTQPGSTLSKFAIFGDFGVAVPHGDFSDFSDPGFSVNTGLEYMITPQFSAEGTLGYNRFPTFFNTNIGLYQVSGNGKFYFVDQSSKVRPFVNGGVGLYVTSGATTHFGGNVGGGVLYEATPHFGIQGAYNFHFVNTGNNIQFSTFQGGVRFRF